MRIIRDEALDVTTQEIYMTNETPFKSFNLRSDDTYKINDKTIGRFYWNSPTTITSTNYSDWTTAGIMYFLNEDTKAANGSESWYYNNFIKENSTGESYEKYIEESTWYLGNVNVTNDYIDETPNSARTHERNSAICPSTITSSSNDENCYVWNNNSPIWIGKVGLLSASDFGYAVSSKNWKLGIMNEKNARSTLENNWLLSDSSSSYLMMSPTSNDVKHVLVLADTGSITSLENANQAVRPVLNLKPNTPIVSGTGTLNSPYKIIEE